MGGRKGGMEGGRKEGGRGEAYNVRGVWEEGDDS